MKKKFSLLPFLIIFTFIIVAFIISPEAVFAQKDKLIKVKVNATPEKCSAFCPKKIDFNATIAVEKPMKISYRWIRSDGAKGPIQKIYFRRPGFKTVNTSWTLGAGGKSYKNYWKAIEVIEPYRFISERAYFNLICLMKVILPSYKISGLIHGGADGRLIGGRKVIVRISTTSFSRSQTLTLDSNGEANYTFRTLSPGSYTITVDKGPSNLANYTSTANACYRGTDPASRNVTLSSSSPHADNQDFKVNFVIAWDHYGDCWGE